MQPVRLAGGWYGFILREKYCWLGWWLICCEKKVLLAGG
jgi:hypothetical protein